MTQTTQTIDLSSIARSPGDGRRIELDVGLDPLWLGSGEYRPEPATPSVLLDVSRTAAGYALRLRFRTGLVGECMRCLGPARVEVEVDAVEVDQRGSADEEFHSPYVEGDDLDLGAWSQDAFVLASPAQIVCSPDCRGLCPECGEPLAKGDHDHPREPDPRWAKLRELG
ncbi:DUF177 domain-containing protein [Thermoleophilia bacterium SCSIO 60948]|nr:DUF177 domain-containing protein [Thermoleophilia bacterium SCSIO 60948]